MRALTQLPGRRRLVPGGVGLRGFASRAAHAVSPMTPHGAAVLAGAGAVELLGRHASLVRGRAPVYSSSRLVILLGVLYQIDVVPHPIYPGVTIVTIGAGEWTTAFAVPTNSESERVLGAAPSSLVG